MRFPYTSGLVPTPPAEYHAMNPDLQPLKPYPFERLNQLKQGISPPSELDHIALSVGEPKHPTPAFISEALLEHLHRLGQYPTTRGLPELRESIADWLTRRFKLAASSMNPETQILPVSGTREALFAFAQCVVDRSRDPVVAMPNPFYQIYEGAALLSGAEPYYINCAPSLGDLPDFESVPASVWQRCQLLYLCNPGNPSGAVMSMEQLQTILGLANRYDFIIASDECYSEIYPNEHQPPVGLLQAASHMGNLSYDRCMVFHSLSKRSNAPGLRSGFVAGQAELIDAFFRYRTYHGCTLSLPVQHASMAAWKDEHHVLSNRDLYREKFSAVLPILQSCLDVHVSDASFYLWPKTPIADDQFAQQLFAQKNVTVLPGRYLSRDTDRGNPGHNHVRMALVAPVRECIEAAHRIADFTQSLS